MFVPENLDHLDISSRQVLDRLLGAVATWNQGYYLEEGFDEGTGPTRVRTGLRLVFTGSGAPPPNDYHFSLHSRLDEWFNLEIVVPHHERYQLQRGDAEFSEGVLRWFHDTHRIADHDIRVMLGRKLFQRSGYRARSWSRARASAATGRASTGRRSPRRALRQRRAVPGFPWCSSRRGR